MECDEKGDVFHDNRGEADLSSRELDTLRIWMTLIGWSREEQAPDLR